MVIEDIARRVLEYLKKHGQTNTFRLATKLEIDRHIILDIVKELKGKGAVEVRAGTVIFLKFPTKEKEEVEKVIKKTHFKPKKKIEHKIKKTIQKKTRVREKVIGDLQAENKELKETIKESQQKINAPPKIIRRTIVKKVPVKSKKLKEQAEHIEELEKTIEELKKKVNAPPKIIRKTIIKKVPVKVKEKLLQKFKLPKFSMAWIKKVQKIKKPKDIEGKIKMEKPKINFSKLNKNIQQLHVPEIIKKRG